MKIEAPPQIHQIAPVLDEYDAISNYTREIQKLLVQWGYDSKIYVWRKQRGQGRLCCHYSRHREVSSPDNVLICHYGISSPIFDYFLSCSDRKIMIYHNVTPSEYFRGINDEPYFLTKQGRAALWRADKNIDLALADSTFNQRELIEAGFSNAKVLPLIIDYKLFDRPANEDILKKYDDGKTNLLFVGRILPNKKQEDLIRIFYYYKHYFNPKSRLFLVGTETHAPKYQRILEELVKRLQLDDVIFTGGVPQDELKAYFSLANLFLCMSEHEGFCVPLVEAMYLDVPILSYSSSAIPETLGDSGVLVNNKDYPKIAALINEILNDDDVIKSIVAKQRRRVEDFRPEKVEKMLKNYIEEIIGE